jgi:hypothetical protein
LLLLLLIIMLLCMAALQPAAVNRLHAYPAPVEASAVQHHRLLAVHEVLLLCDAAAALL